MSKITTPQFAAILRSPQANRGLTAASEEEKSHRYVDLLGRVHDWSRMSKNSAGNPQGERGGAHQYFHNRFASAAMPVATNQGFIAMKCNERASNFFILNCCQTNMAEIESRATGTTFAEINRQNFRPIRVVLPPKELMAAFTAKFVPLYAQLTDNLRDTLLTKLLTGELSVNH